MRIMARYEDYGTNMMQYNPIWPCMISHRGAWTRVALDRLVAPDRRQVDGAAVAGRVEIMAAPQVATGAEVEFQLAPAVSHL